MQRLSGPGPGCWENWDDPHLIVTFITLHLHSSHNKSSQRKCQCFNIYTIFQSNEISWTPCNDWTVGGHGSMALRVPQLIHNIPSTSLSPIQPWLVIMTPLSISGRAERMIGKTQFRLHRQLSKIVCLNLNLYSDMSSEAWIREIGK